jgi:transposase
MNKLRKYVGVDIASETFCAAIGQSNEGSWEIKVKATSFKNHYDSFSQFLNWLKDHGVEKRSSILCMEATGVYGEALAYTLVGNGYQVVVEAPLKVKKAFYPTGHKNDRVDSQQIAEYAYRFSDRIQLWQPKTVVIEQLKVLLTLREQLVTQKTSHHNANRALKRKVVRTPLAEQVHEAAIEQLEKHIQEVDQEIKRLIDEDPSSKELYRLFNSIPGIGPTLTPFLIVMVETAPEPYNPKTLAAYIGICPYEDSSGSSRHKQDTSRHFGPSAIRRLLHLAAMSVRQHCPLFERYFQRKVAEGKPKQLVLNNIANKLLRIVCAIARTRTPYIPGFRSVHPSLLSTN